MIFYTVFIMSSVTKNKKIVRYQVCPCVIVVKDYTRGFANGYAAHN